MEVNKMNEIQFINLTPHDVIISKANDDYIIPRSGKVARVLTKYLNYEIIDTILVSNQLAVDIRNLPNPAKNTFYIVSSRVAGAVSKTRTDVLSPDIQTAIKDSRGKIQKVRQLVRYK